METSHTLPRIRPNTQHECPKTPLWLLDSNSDVDEVELPGNNGTTSVEAGVASGREESKCGSVLDYTTPDPSQTPARIVVADGPSPVNGDGTPPYDEAKADRSRHAPNDLGGESIVAPVPICRKDPEALAHRTPENVVEGLLRATT
jgi:hypothetical protein